MTTFACQCPATFTGTWILQKTSMVTFSSHIPMVTSPWSHSHGHIPMVTLPWSHYHGHISMVTIPWSHPHGHNSMVTFPWSHPHGHNSMVQFRGHNFMVEKKFLHKMVLVSSSVLVKLVFISISVTSERDFDAHAASSCVPFSTQAWRCTIPATRKWISASPVLVAGMARAFRKRDRSTVFVWKDLPVNELS